MKRVAVIVLNWNQWKVTLECVNSLLEVDYPEYRVFVVDNGSEGDDYRSLTENINDPRVRVCRSEVNRLYAGGNNFGYRIAAEYNPDYLLFLNNDTVVDRGFLGFLVEPMERDESIAIAGPKIYYYDSPELIWHAGGYVSFFTGKIAHYGIREKDDAKWNNCREVDYVSGCALFIRRDIFEEAGGFDESYGIYTEDVDLCYRVKRMGYRVIYVPESRIWHKISASSGGGITPFKVRNKFLSNMKFFKRYGKVYHWFFILPCYFVRAFAFAVAKLFSFRGKDFINILRGILGFVK